MKKILILSISKDGSQREILDGFALSLNSQSEGAFECEVRHYSELEFIIGDGENDVKISGTDRSVLSYDFVYFRTFVGFMEQAVSLAHILSKHEKQFFCSELLIHLTTTKLAQYAILSVNNIPLPRTVYIHPTMYESAFENIREVLAVPFIMKAVDGKGGNNNFLVESKEQFQEIYQTHPKIDFIFQKFIPNSGDLRVLIVGSEIRLVINRARVDDSTHLNNTSQGASAKLLDKGELTDQVQALSLSAAAALKREIAGVDVMFEETTGKPYILEVNSSPQIGSGAFVDEKIEVFVDLFKNI